jgi:hypothetical protein
MLENSENKRKKDSILSQLDERVEIEVIKFGEIVTTDLIRSLVSQTLPLPQTQNLPRLQLVRKELEEVMESLKGLLKDNMDKWILNLQFRIKCLQFCQVLEKVIDEEQNREYCPFHHLLI